MGLELHQARRQRAGRFVAHAIEQHHHRLDTDRLGGLGHRCEARVEELGPVELVRGALGAEAALDPI